MRQDSLGDRMKDYERAFKVTLPRRLPVILRVDGKAFHTATRNCVKPFDIGLVSLMNRAAVRLCEEAQGAVFAYVQSDEISVLLHNYKRIHTQSWFDNEVQKMASIAAATVSSFMTENWKPVMFDARVFCLPESDVCNYFVWRQQDAIRNSIQMATRAVYSHSKVENKNQAEMLEMLKEKGIDWHDYDVGYRRGRAVVREYRQVESRGKDNEVVQATRSEWRVKEPPVFSEDRAYIEQHLATEDEE